MTTQKSSTVEVILFEPEIPPNTGNIIRLCANTGCTLHLIEPLGFSLDARAVRRAGLDYHDMTSVRRYSALDDCLHQLNSSERKVFAFSTKGKRTYADVTYQSGDILLFGPESRGLPAQWLSDAAIADVVRIPMRQQSRSLNLSNAVAVGVYEAWRQLNFDVNANQDSQ